MVLQQTWPGAYQEIWIYGEGEGVGSRPSPPPSSPLLPSPSRFPSLPLPLEVGLLNPARGPVGAL